MFELKDPLGEPLFETIQISLCALTLHFPAMAQWC